MAKKCDTFVRPSRPKCGSPVKYKVTNKAGKQFRYCCGNHARGFRASGFKVTPL